MAWTIIDDGGSGERSAVLFEDAAGNDKTLDFTAELALLKSRRFQIDWITVDYNPSGAAGNRGVVLELMRGADTLLTLVSGTTVAASIREVSSYFHRSGNSVTFTTAGGTAFTPIATNDPMVHGLTLFAGLSLQVRDPNNISVTDVMKVRIGGRLS